MTKNMEQKAHRSRTFFFFFPFFLQRVIFLLCFFAHINQIQSKRRTKIHECKIMVYLQFNSSCCQINTHQNTHNSKRNKPRNCLEKLIEAGTTSLIYYYYNLFVKTCVCVQFSSQLNKRITMVTITLLKVLLLSSARYSIPVHVHYTVQLSFSVLLLFDKFSLNVPDHSDTITNANIIDVKVTKTHKL